MTGEPTLEKRGILDNLNPLINESQPKMTTNIPEILLLYMDIDFIIAFNDYLLEQFAYMISKKSININNKTIYSNKAGDHIYVY